MEARVQRAAGDRGGVALRTHTLYTFAFPGEPSAKRAAAVLQAVFRGRELPRSPRALHETATALRALLEGAGDLVEFFRAEVVNGSAVELEIETHAYLDQPPDGSPPGGPDIKAALGHVVAALGGRDPLRWPELPDGWAERAPDVDGVEIGTGGTVARVRPAGNGTAILKLEAGANESVLEAALRAAIMLGAGRIAIDLETAMSLTSDDLDTIAAARACLEPQGGAIVLFGVTEHWGKLPSTDDPSTFRTAISEEVALQLLGAGHAP